MAREKKEPTVNYTDEQADELAEAYRKGRSEGESNETLIATLAEEFQRKPKSVRAKLSHMGVYEQDVKAPKEPKDTGPTKEEQLKSLRELGIATEGLEPATKKALGGLIDFVKSKQVA